MKKNTGVRRLTYIFFGFIVIIITLIFVPLLYISNIEQYPEAEASITIGYVCWTVALLYAGGKLALKGIRLKDHSGNSADVGKGVKNMEQELLGAIKVRIAEIESDTRYQSGKEHPADININAPLALVQVSFEAEIKALRWVLQEAGI